MSGRLAVALACCLAGLGWAQPSGATLVEARTAAQFNAAVERFGNRAGTIVLTGGRYGTLRVGWRSRAARWLTVKAAPGAVTRHVVLSRARRVRLVGLRVAPYQGADALLQVSGSSRVRVEGVRVAGAAGRLARVRVWRSARVTVRDSDLSRCGERAVCLGFPGSRIVRVAGNTFHDCAGCDFVAVSRVDGLVLRRNTFDRALPGTCGQSLACNHQDLVQVIGGRNLLIEGNRFGLYSYGAAQLYVPGGYGVDGLTIRGNVFLRADPSLPGLEAANGIIIGNPPMREGQPYPLRVVVAGNTILSGSPRDVERFCYWPGVSNSVIVSEGYEGVPAELRPLIVNNMVGRTSHPGLLCPHVFASGHNHLADASPCTDLDSTGEPLIDETGVPSEGSPLRDRAEPSWATPADFTGRLRDDGAPDIGAFEWRPQAV